jgi:chromosome segregation ATPase
MILFNRDDRQLNFACLKKLETERQALQSANEGLERRQHELSYLAEKDALSASQTVSIDQIKELSRTRSKLRAEAESLGGQIAANNRRLEEAASEHQQMRDRLDTLLSSRERLFRAISEARSNEEHAALQLEMLEVIRTLAVFSGDAKAVAEFKKAEAEHRASLPYITLRRGYAWTADRRLVPEDDVSARFTAYGRAVRVPRDEAATVGLLELEAA